MSGLVDPNVLLRRTQPTHPHHDAAVESVARLLETGDPVFFTPQNIAEFWNAMTRLEVNSGLGFSPAMAAAEADRSSAR
jgi:predicted nucleic acid-binding protein